MPAKKRITRKSPRRGQARRGSTQSGGSAPATSAKPRKKPHALSAFGDPKLANALVVLRSDAGTFPATPIQVSQERLVELASHWMYVMRNRCRWAGSDEHKAVILERAVETCEAIGLKKPVLTQLVTTDSRQLELAFNPSKADTTAFDAACCFPWEFVLSSATRQMGRSVPFVITRLFESPALGESTDALLFVESAPGRVQDLYSFESERARLRTSTKSRWQLVKSPTEKELASRVKARRPRVVHFSGVDTHQAGVAIKDFYKGRPDVGKEGPRDGAILRGDLLSEVPVAHAVLANLLVGGDGAETSPSLVVLNAYYSAARTARDCVRAGARASIGFLDEVDDELAEVFFHTFYQQWNPSSADATIDSIPHAFGQTWKELREQEIKLFGTGIVLWLAESALGEGRPRIFLADPDEESQSDDGPAPEPASDEKLTVCDVLQVDLKLSSEINYSLLHNARPLLESLTLYKLCDQPLEDVTVEVQLNAGDVQLPFRYTEPLLDQPQLSLANDVRVPLTGPMFRALRERVQSTVYAKVAWKGHTAIEETRAVTLLPVDEWLDDSSHPWLPSFVLPRDPAVSRIVGGARRHLVTLQDDPNASFDGYQSVVDRKTRDPDCSAVDAQVQAIWTALVQDVRLAYVNPPPAYSSRNQRLRTPSEMLASSSGTCIDLALLLASCLEYIDVYPVLVLLTGHAFVGYWRCEEFHTSFAQIETVPDTARLELGPESIASTVPLVEPYGWRLARQQYKEILGYLKQGRLRFLEATGLCFNYSFAEALDEGRANIRAKRDFDSLLDVALARRSSPPVTPLPVIVAAER